MKSAKVVHPRGRAQRSIAPALAVLFVIFALGCSQPEPPPAPADPAARARDAAAKVDGARIAAADSEPGNWLAHGRTYDEQRFSPLDQINDQNVGQLGLAWHYDTGRDRGHEATPIVVDGVMFVTALVERGVRARRRHRRAALEVRPEGAGRRRAR